MTKINFLKQALANNGNNMNFFDDCSICPLREQCRAEEEGKDDIDVERCDDFLNRVLTDD